MILHIVREFLNKEKEDDTGGDTSNPAYETSPTFELEKGSHASTRRLSLEEDSLEDNDIDDSGEFGNPVADESQESHSPSPSFVSAIPWHCVVGWPQVHTDSMACR